mmetsp:Transcript_14118/g.38697  ORF Transcript_14118/g.38697 Transcript_14118/m.38697 type:complete len:223 (+) Transcript_14118:459-1127(+)
MHAEEVCVAAQHDRTSSTPAQRPFHARVGQRQPATQRPGALRQRLLKRHQPHHSEGGCLQLCLGEPPAAGILAIVAPQRLREVLRDLCVKRLLCQPDGRLCQARSQRSKCLLHGGCLPKRFNPAPQAPNPSPYGQGGGVLSEERRPGRGSTSARGLFEATSVRQVAVAAKGRWQWPNANVPRQGAPKLFALRHAARARRNGGQEAHVLGRQEATTTDQFGNS